MSDVLVRLKQNSKVNGAYLADVQAAMDEIERLRQTVSTLEETLEAARMEVAALLAELGENNVHRT